MTNYQYHLLMRLPRGLQKWDAVQKGMIGQLYRSLELERRSVLRSYFEIV